MFGDEMMKRTAALILIVLLLASPAYAAAAGDQGKSGRIVDGNGSAGGNGGAAPDDAAGPVQNRTAEKEQKHLHEQVRDRINQTSAEDEARAEGLSGPAQAAWKNQNAVRTAVHAFLALGDLDGGIGQNVSAIAREYNNSLATRLQAEEQIHQNAGLGRFFFGGDTAAAGKILADLNRSREQVREMKRLVENCTCDNETGALLMEQIRAMEQEQERLRELAEGEISEKGLFGWIWK
ncbi:MAG TPA: hypothetical protein ENN52_00350 [Methanofollis liminatans]|uniref:Uncharacterized protein n=1 Tax=Methanofollis liminatans TaxID=2201 RepID=A0A831LJV2_9EURY|nr:hypothetical protein [Methanofollis liminatans]